MPAHPADVQPVEHELRDRIITGLVTGLPVLGLGAAVWQAWNGLLRPSDAAVFFIVYVLTGFGVTVGFHRLLTHRSFKAAPLVRGALAILGSAAVEGPAISWVADHRKHHKFSDRLGDPHSPHVDHGVGLTGALRGLHAHVGWLFRHDQRGARARYAPDLLDDPVIRFVDATFVVWALAGLAAAFGSASRSAVPSPRGSPGCLGRRREALRPPSRHVQHQLDLPRLRPPPVPDL